MSEPRRAVTLVVSDLKGSTALAERFDAETLRSVLTRYFDEMRLVLESHGGSIAKIIGDAIVTVFDGTDDPGRAARRAVRAAVETQAALEWLNDRFDATWGVRLQNRTGVASGHLSATELADSGLGSDVLAGDVIGAAESLETSAPTMEVLIDGATLDLVGDAAITQKVGPVPRKGGAGTIDAWQLISVRAPKGDVGPERPEGAARLCDACGFANDSDTRRCTSCGAALATGDHARESRRMVTIVFADPKPKSLDGVALASAVTQAVMTQYFDTMRPILERHGGTVEKFIGDALMAVFGLPVRHEDDALRAVRAAGEMRDALAALNQTLRERYRVTLANPVGVNTGIVVAGDPTEGQRLVTGDAVNVAARLEQTAGAGEVLLGDLTRRLVGADAETDDVAPLTLKGKAQPVPAHRLVRLAGPGRTGRRHDLPLVGRDAELQILRTAFRDAVHDRHCSRATLIGDAGSGKSRLTHEFVAEASRVARVVQGSCLPYGDGVTFWPLLEVVHDAAGIVEGDDSDTARSRLAALIGDEPDVLERVASMAGLVATPYAVSELGWAARRFFERLGSLGPTVVIFDDVQWAESTFLDLVDQIAGTVEAPVFVLCAARPAVYERHRPFVEGAATVVLAPLTDADCERFLRLLLGSSGIDARVTSRIVDTAGGNPLFIEQLLSMLIDDGRLRFVDGDWRVEGDLATLEVPASIEALLTARLDRLRTDERRVIEPASVIGRRFEQRAVEYLVDSELRPVVSDRLRDLGDRDLVLPDELDDLFRFQHQLIRDATYNSLLKESRAILHEAFVRWGDSVNEARDRATEYEEIQGYHLEQAYLYWQELGPVDDHIAAVGVSASQRLGSAGERALARADIPAAVNLLTRAARLLPDEHATKPRVLLLAGSALYESGAFDDATAAFDESARCAEARSDYAAAESGRIEQLRVRYLIGRVDDLDSISIAVKDALVRLDPIVDNDALSRAWQLQLHLDIAACRWARAAHDANQVIEYAERAANTVLAVKVMPLLASLAEKGPMPLPEAISRCEEILERVSSDRRASATTRLEIARLSAMAGDVEYARSLCADTRSVLRELGWEKRAALVSLTSGPNELLADEPARAELELRHDYEALQRMGERNFIALTVALLAEAVYRQSRFDESRELVGFSRAIAAADDLAVQIVWRSVAGKLAARDGDSDSGLRLTHEALEMIETTDDPAGQGDALLDVAEATFLSGDLSGATTTALAAADRYKQKGSTLGIRRATRLAEAMAAGRDPLG